MANLSNLPKELVEKTLLDLPVPDILKYLSSSKTLYTSLTEQFWIDKAQKDFGITLLSQKEIVKREYFKQKRDVQLQKEFDDSLKSIDYEEVKSKKEKLIGALNKYLMAKYDLKEIIKLLHNDVCINETKVNGHEVIYKGYTLWTDQNNGHFELEIIHQYQSSIGELHFMEQAKLIGKLSDEIGEKGAIYRVLELIEKYFP